MVKNSTGILGRILSRWVDAVVRFAPWVLIAVTGVTGLLLSYTVNNLGISTDTTDMLSESVHFRRFQKEYRREFPQYDDTMLIVIEGDTPDIAHDASSALASRLKRETDLFQTVYFPAGEKFFQEHALLYLSRSELEDLADNLAKVQPFLAKLSRDQSLRGLFSMIREAVKAVIEGEDIDLSPLFKRINEAIVAALNQRFYELSWLELIRGDRSEPDDRRSFIVVQPCLDYSTLIPAKAAMQAVRSFAQELKLNRDNGVRIHVTGDVALEYEEMRSVSRGAVLAGILALLLVGVVLIVGLGSPRLVFCTLVTLVIGLIWTAGFATATIGHLNMISVAFGVLYIGLGVDYAIHFCLRYKELIEQDNACSAAISLTAKDVGSSLVLCACTTAIAFYAFIPTVFAGVAELGIISGTGMFIGLFVSITILPALLSLMPLSRKRISNEKTPGRLLDVLLALPVSHTFAIRTGTVIVGVGALFLLPQVKFDRNTLNLQNPESESVSTFRELLAQRKASPWSLKVLAPNSRSARQYKLRLGLLEAVDKTVILDDFVPDEQDEKLAIIEDIVLIMGPDQFESEKEEPPTTSEQMAELGNLEAILEGFLEEENNSPLKVEARGLLDVLKIFSARIGEQEESFKAKMLKRLKRSLFASLPERLQELQTSLSADRITKETLPEDLVRRWVSDKGYYRVEIFPSEDLNDDEKMSGFIEAVRKVAPDAVGYPVIILEAGNAVVTAFRQAFLLSLVSITALLIILMKRKSDAILVIILLLLAGALTGAVSVLLDIPFNFANVIALPLILGIGVDGGIHMVRRMRTAPPASGHLLKTSTSRAVLFSGLTTISGFGNLALSTHPGMASMGKLLSIGIGFTLLCTLIVLPALLKPE
jgi:hopanoid biosynthesis associated RND transporter like protein HpnN